jgi:hypothetical protein
MDWQTWHDEYDLPGSALARRLGVVQEQIVVALDSSPPGPLQVISLCAGQGRDLLEVLAGHPRRDDVRARLVELDVRNTAMAEETARAAGLDQVEVVAADAALTDQYRGFDRQWLSEQDVFGVGVHRFTGEPRPLTTGERMFTFIGYDMLTPETATSPSVARI